MSISRGFRISVSGFALLAAGVTLSGCVSPTYGTGKSSAEQLVDDLGSAVSLSSPSAADKGIKYNPRPGLVKPAGTQMAALEAPQTSIASKDNPAWVESPEETRKRLAEEAEANKDNINYRSPLVDAARNSKKLNSQQQTEAFRAARAEQMGAYDDRRYLTDPPTTYRSVSDPTALTDLGEPEAKKEKARKKKAKLASTGSNWWWPFQ